MLEDKGLESLTPVEITSPVPFPRCIHSAADITAQPWTNLSVMYSIEEQGLWPVAQSASGWPLWLPATSMNFLGADFSHEEFPGSSIWPSQGIGSGQGYVTCHWLISLQMHITNCPWGLSVPYPHICFSCPFTFQLSRFLFSLATFPTLTLS